MLLHYLHRGKQEIWIVSKAFCQIALRSMYCVGKILRGTHIVIRDQNIPLIGASIFLLITFLLCIVFAFL